MRNLITPQEVIELAFAENSNMREESISATSIHIAEIKYIRPAFGEMYALLGDKYADYTNDYVKPALAYFVKCEIVSSIAIDMSNSGIAIANPQYQSAASDKQRQRLYDSEMSKAKTLLDFALEYVAAHREEFPEFEGNAPKKHHRVGGILLGGGSLRSQSASIVGDSFKSEIDRLDKRIDGIAGGATTPSGDPMHYAYEDCGAVWNEDTGYWEFYDMKDITSAEMRKAYARGSWYTGASAMGALCANNEQSSSAIRFNFARTGPWSVNVDMDYFSQPNPYVEFINLTFDNNLISAPFTNATYLNDAFSGCSKLRRIYGEIETSGTNGVRDAFKGCASLEDVSLYGLKLSISFSDSPKLSKTSLLYAINNASSETLIITLHASAYSRLANDSEVKIALNKKKNITLASA